MPCLSIIFFNITLVFLVSILLMKLVSERPKLYISVILINTAQFNAILISHQILFACFICIELWLLYSKYNCKLAVSVDLVKHSNFYWRSSTCYIDFVKFSLDIFQRCISVWVVVVIIQRSWCACSIYRKTHVFGNR